MIVPSASCPAGDRRAVDRRRGLLDDLLGQHPHGVVVAVGLIHLQRRELRVVLEVHPFVAELPADLEYLLHAADDEPLQVQLSRDPEVKLKIIGVDVGLEGPGVRARRGSAAAPASRPR